MLQRVGLRGRCVQSSIPTHSQKRQVKFHDHVAALPRRGWPKNIAALLQMYCWQSVLLTVQEDVDMVAADFNGASQRRKSGLEQQYDSTLDEAFNNARLPVPPPHRCGALVEYQVNGPMCADLSSHQKSQTKWLIRKHGAFEIDGEELRLSSEDQTSHHETWIHLSRVGTLVC